MNAPSPTEIEREIAKTRARLSHGLAVLDREYALRNLFVHAVRYAESESEGLKVKETIARNALPLGLIGAGIVWLRLSDRDPAFWRHFGAIVRRFLKFGAELPALFQPRHKGPVG